MYIYKKINKYIHTYKKKKNNIKMDFGAAAISALLWETIEEMY